MSDDSKPPNEIELFYSADYGLAYNQKMTRSKSEKVRYIEKSAYDSIVRERDELLLNIEQSEPQFKDLIRQRDQAVAEAKALAEALEYCRLYDTSGNLGEYNYGQEVRGRKPGLGQRFKTPKERASSALTDTIRERYLK